MPASASLSVELWQAILRYSIGIADFLDPDAFEGVIAEHIFCDKRSPINDEVAYWCSEKTRNSLQRVCKSWNTYLRHFDHRFVRVLDIRHEKVTAKTLGKAIRVSFSRYNCSCEEFCSEEHFETFCWRTIQQMENMQMVIADMKAEIYGVNQFMDIPRLFDNVQTLIAPCCGYSSSFATLLLKFSNLRHFYGKGYRGTQENGPNNELIAKNLVTLSCHTRRGVTYKDCKWDLPCLRHLRLKSHSSQELSKFVEEAALPILRMIGSQLHSLYLYHMADNYDMPGEIWHLCPNIERFRTGMSFTHPPPFFHPVRILVVDREQQLDLIQARPEWPNLERIIVDREIVVGGIYTQRFQSRRDTILEDRSGVIKLSEVIGSQGSIDNSAFQIEAGV